MALTYLAKGAFFVKWRKGEKMRIENLEKNKTGWIPSTKKPTRIGWYECSICNGARHYWDGKKWYVGPSDVEDNSPMKGDQLTGWAWRGMTVEAHIEAFNEMNRKNAKRQQKQAQKAGGGGGAY